MIIATSLAVGLLTAGTALQDPVLSWKAVDPTSPQQAVLARDMSLSGEALLLGGPNANNGPGFATLFEIDGSGRATKVQDVTWSFGQFNDYFGWGVAIDAGHAAVGARFADPSGVNNAGAVQLYDRGTSINGTVELTGRDVLVSPLPLPGGLFGESLALEGTILAVGEPGGRGLQPGAGAVHLYDLATTPATLLATLFAPGGSAGDDFGLTVHLENGVLLASAGAEDLGPVQRAGTVHVFAPNGQGGWSHVARLESPTPETDSGFGTGLDLSGNRITVGAPYEDNGGTDLGAVHVFERQGTAYPHVETIDPHQPNTQFLFGSEFAYDGNRLFVGASGSAAAAGRAGEIQVFERVSGAWQFDHAFLAPDLGVGDRFGLHIEIANGRLVTSAKGGDEPHFNSGCAYVYSINGDAPEPFVPLFGLVEVGTVRTHHLLVRPGPSAASDFYFVFGSANPTPSLVAGLQLPFTLDSYSDLTLLAANKGPFGQTSGLLDTNGEARATFSFDPSVTAPLAGLTLYHAAVVIDSTTLVATHVLGAEALEFVP